MAKTATIGIRVDEDLKNRAQEQFDSMGLPMSLAIEMFLRQVVKTGRLPFAVGQDGGDDSAARTERKKREKDFWREFTVWYFKAWPSFQSAEIEAVVSERLGHRPEATGEKACDYIVGDTGGYPEKMTDAQWEAYLDYKSLRILLGDAKELVYWALGLDKVFVPSLASRYDADKWRLDFVDAQIARGKLKEPGSEQHDRLD